MLDIEKKLFTSESVGPGHPDKLCDQVSDAILDAIIAQDPFAHVAIECFTTTELFVIGGEVSGNAKVDFEKIARDTMRSVGYTKPEIGIGADTCKVLVVVKEQSSDIAQGVNNSQDEHDIGAGDQGIMFGYACKETPEYMPLAIILAHRIMELADEKRKLGEFKWARPDMKSQVTMDYTNPEKVRIDTILVSIQHDPEAIDAEYKNYIKNFIIREVVDRYGLNHDYKVLINPTGRFVIGGPAGDTGLTGRKIIVDTYGGYAKHGGGAFSGKDCTKVDRSAAYMARYVAKNLVAAGFADKIEIQLSYAIGISKPVSIEVDSFGTGKVSDSKILEVIAKNFDLTPSGIISTLKLRRPIYFQTATYGHFGRNNLNLPWEELDKVQQLMNLK